jgi:hypothetical protein
MNNETTKLQEDLDWEKKKIETSLKCFAEYFANQPEGPKDPSGIPMSVPYEIYWAWRSLVS